MPPCEALYLVAYLFEIGPTIAAGMGEAVVTHQEIQSWQQNTGIELQTWEARFVRKLSHEYLSESFKAKSRDAVAPWESAAYAKPVIDNVGASLKASMYELAAL